jgi:hypothetical protein
VREIRREQSPLDLPEGLRGNTTEIEGEKEKVEVQIYDI